MANPFGAIWKGLKIGGKAAFENRELIYTFTPIGTYARSIENAVALVNEMKRAGTAPTTSAGKREKAREIAREQSEDAKRTTNRALDFQLEIERLKQKYPDFIQ